MADSQPVLILPPRYTPDSVAMWRAAVHAGWRVERLHDWRVPPELRERDLAIYAEPMFAAVVAQDLDIVLLEPPFDWLAGLPDQYSKRDVRYAVLSDARQVGAPAFVKPADDKSFPARVYPSGVALPSEDVLPGTLPVLIAEPVTWGAEFRCFVLEGRVVTSSIYSRDGELAQTEDGAWPAEPEETNAALKFAATVLADVSTPLPPAVVLDVGVIEGRGWAVVEANPAWGSGIYGCAPAAVLNVCRRACERTSDLSAQDARWLPDRPSG